MRNDAIDSAQCGEAAWARLPEDHELVAGLASVASVATIRLISRSANAFWTSFPSELVTFEMPDGTVERVFCKYGGPVTGDAHSAYGHRGGVPYEARVYREVLRDLAPGVPKLLGTWSLDDATICLVIERVDALYINQVEPAAVVPAATWIGRFHARAAASGHVTRSRLNRYDEAFYRGWITRTEAFASTRPLHWLASVCHTAHRALDVLLDAPLTVIHGEYFPENIFADDDGIHPVDWESTAIAPGEIDLASLTDRWPVDIAAACEAAYRSARWPDGVDAEIFDQRLLAARMHVQFRWLGDSSGQTAGAEADWRFDTLLELAHAANWI